MVNNDLWTLYKVTNKMLVFLRGVKKQEESSITKMHRENLQGSHRKIKGHLRPLHHCSAIFLLQYHISQLSVHETNFWCPGLIV